MDSHLVLQRDHPQVTALKFRDGRPESIPIVLLWLRTDGVLYGKFTPCLLQIRTSSAYLVLEIRRVTKLPHGSSIPVPVKGFLLQRNEHDQRPPISSPCDPFQISPLAARGESFRNCHSERMRRISRTQMLGNRTVFDSISKTQ